MASQSSNGKAPVKRFVSGKLSLAIFENEGEGSRKFYSMLPQRSFQREGSEEWETTSSLNRDNAPVMSSLLMMGHAWVVQREDANRLAAKAEETAPA